MGERRCATSSEGTKGKDQKLENAADGPWMRTEKEKDSKAIGIKKPCLSSRRRVDEDRAPLQGQKPVAPYRIATPALGRQSAGNDKQVCLCIFITHAGREDNMGGDERREPYQSIISIVSNSAVQCLMVSQHYISFPDLSVLMYFV